jgi:hypothetical protein
MLIVNSTERQRIRARSDCCSDTVSWIGNLASTVRRGATAATTTTVAAVTVRITVIATCAIIDK